MKPIDKSIDNYYSQPQELTNIFQESFFMMKLLDKKLKMVKDLSIFYSKMISYQELKLIKVYKSFQELLMKTGLQVWILWLKNVKNIMLWDVDSLNLELFLKLMRRMDYHLNKQFKKMHGH